MGVLEEIKSEENPAQYSILQGSDTRLRMFIAWQYLKVEFSPVGDEETLEELWASCFYDHTNWYKAADADDLYAPRHADILKSNRLIYPDGTINDVVKRIVTAVVAKEATKRR